MLFATALKPAVSDGIRRGGEGLIVLSWVFIIILFYHFINAVAGVLIIRDAVC